MRQIVLDTETTGISPAEGHRLIENAGIELKDGALTGKTYHQFINPKRASDPEALAIHGLTEEFLNQQPVFKDIVGEFLGFIDQTELIIHHAPFDVGFINNELKLAGLGDHTIADRCRIIDTYALAIVKFPEQLNTLDALCKRFGIVNREGKYKGAMRDAALLASVYTKVFR